MRFSVGKMAIGHFVPYVVLIYNKKNTRSTFLPHLRGMALTEDDVDQETNSTRCGQLCMAFGHIFLAHGYEAAQKC